MITKNIEGIVFNIFNYQDNALIVDVFTKEYGFISLKVKGGQKSSSKAFHIFKMFNIISFDVLTLNVNGLSNYRSGEVIEYFDFTKLDYFSMNMMMLISEVLQKTKHLNDFNFKNYYQLVKEIIKKVNQEDQDNYSLLNLFLLETLKMLGSQPVLDSCLICQKITKIKAYSYALHGFICQDCLENNNDLDNENISYQQDLLRYLYHLNKYQIVDVDNKIKINLRYYLLNTLNDNTGLYLKSSKYLKEEL